MKIIIHLGDSYPNEGPNAKRMRTFFEEFQRRGHEVYVIAPKTKHEKTCRDKHIIYCYTTSLKKKTTLTRTLNHCVFGVNSVLHALLIRKADVVITTSPPALLSPFGWVMAKCLRAKLVYDVRDIWPDVAWEMGSFSKDSIYSKVFGYTRDFMLHHADLVTAVSRGKVEKLKSYHPKSEVSYIPNGLDEVFLKNKVFDELCNKYRLGEIYTCVYIGNLGLAQGLEQLLKIAQRAADNNLEVQFLLFGSGVEEKYLKEFVRVHGLNNVFLPGRLPNEMMYTILKYSDMSFVSLVNGNLKDSVPTKMFEALGVGCPVLLAACGEAADILRETSLGIAVSPNDADALWEGFMEIYKGLDNLELRKNTAQKVILANYSRQKAACKMEELITSL